MVPDERPRPVCRSSERVRVSEELARKHGPGNERPNNHRLPKALADTMTLEARAEFYLRDAEALAWLNLSRGKWGQFGYWAAKVVQFRELLGKSHEPSPFRELQTLATSRAQGWREVWVGSERMEERKP